VSTDIAMIVAKGFRKAQGALASLVVAVIFLVLTVVIWIIRPDVRQYVRQRLPAVYELIPK